MLLTVSEYKEMGFCEGKTDSELAILIARAEALIKTLIVREIGGDISANALDEVKRAIAFQAEYYVINGFDEGYTQVRIGDFSASLHEKREVSRMAMIALKKSGLYFKGVEVL